MLSSGTSSSSSGPGSSTGSGGCAAAPGTPQATGSKSGLDACLEQLSPPDDVMYYYRQLMSLPPYPGETADAAAFCRVNKLHVEQMLGTTAGDAPPCGMYVFVCMCVSVQSKMCQDLCTT
jgi:hypothetical protein